MAIWIIIAVSMLFIVGPILMLRPSPRERRLARIRQLAQQQRVNIQPIFLRRDPVFSATLERNPHLAEHSWARYQRVAEENQTGPSIKGKWVQRRTPEGQLVWEAQDIRQTSAPAIDAVLARWQQEQKPDFLALELGPRSVTLVWNEKGDVAEVEAVCQQLRELLAV